MQNRSESEEAEALLAEARELGAQTYKHTAVLAQPTEKEYDSILRQWDRYEQRLLNGRKMLRLL
jgi:hypothetical protein